MPAAALEGIRIVDLSQGIAGPYCTALLAALGAEVLKVEPPGGDYARALGPFRGDVPHPDGGGLFAHLNGGKKSVTLDIETESGRVVLRKLLAQADVLVESDAPGRLASLGLGYDSLKASLPGLIYCSITPFGQTGPYRDFKGNSLACMALSGLMYITGDPDKEPLCTGGEPAEYFAALHAWVAVLAALEHRARTNAGQHIDVSMLEALGCADEYNTAMYSYLGAVRKRYYSRHHIPTYPSEIFPCRNGHIVVIGGAGGFPLMMAVLIEQPDLESNPLFTNLWLRTFQWREFEKIVRPYLAEHDWEDLLTRAQELRMPFAAVLDARTLLENEHLRERGFFAEIDQPGAGKLPVAANPFRLSETPLRHSPAPRLGEHTHEVLADAGYQGDDEVILRERGIT
ncbi:MAG: CoA transferase [Dehalococcoidia bacterium]|nr:CoA transferase [Dehalococcoidia bacterium]